MTRHVSDGWDVVVVGAGVVGLATAYTLVARGVERVLVLERDTIAGAQSAGLTRIFRTAHRSPSLCALALEAHGLWRAWESALGVGTLVGEEGLVVAHAAEELTRFSTAMAAAGVAPEPLAAPEVAARMPLLGAAGSPGEAAFWDRWAGAVRVRRTVRTLAARLEVREGVEVVSVAESGQLRLADGSTLSAGCVLLCAGTGTRALGRDVGVDLGVEAFHHVRLTYAPRAGARPGAVPALIFPDGYGVPVGSSGRFALGLEEEPLRPFASTPVGEEVAAARARHAVRVPELLPELDPTPVDEVRCVTLRAPWLQDGDGFCAERAGRVVVFEGSNLMKFAPLLGDRLARSVLDHPDAVHPDLGVAAHVGAG